ncbi:fibronectin type III domain-containing protein 5 [Scomber japonicus]|uniref:fibronectin type III domain-containing protein 5 n=1 Tax=Scomber japonicus TaxID=13676 RepID=UPI0023055A6E|nr:fibronectin type III domain-containing protein 5 [Scomber japonicus]
MRDQDKPRETENTDGKNHGGIRLWCTEAEWTAENKRGSVPIEVSVTGKESFTRQAMEELPKSRGVVATQKYSEKLLQRQTDEMKARTKQIDSMGLCKGEDSLSPPVNVTIKAVKANSAVVTWDIPEGDPVIGFAITQQKKDVRMLRFIQEVNTTTRSCALWDLEEETDYIVHVQSISMSGSSPLSEPLRFRTPKEAETQASKSKDEVTMEEVGQTTQLRAGELIIIVVVLIMWAGVIALFCRQYDIIKDNEPNNNKDKAKNSSECSTPEHPTGGLLRSKFPKNNNNNRMPSVNIIEV